MYGKLAFIVLFTATADLSPYLLTKILRNQLLQQSKREAKKDYNALLFIRGKHQGKKNSKPLKEQFATRAKGNKQALGKNDKW